MEKLYQNKDWLYTQYIILERSIDSIKHSCDNAFIYTIGMDCNGNIAIAVCTPNDAFEPTLGVKIVEGRLKRLNGQLKNKNGTIRKPYDSIPPYIFPKKTNENEQKEVYTEMPSNGTGDEIKRAICCLQ